MADTDLVLLNFGSLMLNGQPMVLLWSMVNGFTRVNAFQANGVISQFTKYLVSIFILSIITLY